MLRETIIHPSDQLSFPGICCSQPADASSVPLIDSSRRDDEHLQVLYAQLDPYHYAIIRRDDLPQHYQLFNHVGGHCAMMYMQPLLCDVWRRFVLTYQQSSRHASHLQCNQLIERILQRSFQLNLQTSAGQMPPIKHLLFVVIDIC